MSTEQRTLANHVEIVSISVTSTATSLKTLIDAALSAAGITVDDNLRVVSIELLAGASAACTYLGPNGTVELSHGTTDTTPLNCLSADQKYRIKTSTTATCPVRINYGAKAS